MKSLKIITTYMLHNFVWCQNSEKGPYKLLLQHSSSWPRPRRGEQLHSHRTNRRTPPLSSQLSGGPKLAQNGTASSSCSFPLPPTQTAETRPFLLLLLRPENKASTCSHITISVNKVTSLNDQWTASKSFLGPSTHALGVIASCSYPIVVFQCLHC